jgi:hypothetical protein
VGPLLVGVHLPPLVAPDRSAAELTGFERVAIERLDWHAATDSGYSREHATEPQRSAMR